VVDVTEISTIVAAAGVLVGVVLTVLELRHLRKQRDTDLLMRLAPWLNINCIELQQAMVKIINLKFKDYPDFVKKYGPLTSEKPDQMAIMMLANYMETVGTLVREGLVDANFVYKFWGHNLILYYEKFRIIAEGAIEEDRKTDQHWYVENKLEESNADYLYNEMKKIEQRFTKTQ
jgi:hypothetical protein